MQNENASNQPVVHGGQLPNACSEHQAPLRQNNKHIQEETPANVFIRASRVLAKPQSQPNAQIQPIHNEHQSPVPAYHATAAAKPAVRALPEPVHRQQCKQHGLQLDRKLLSNGSQCNKRRSGCLQAAVHSRFQLRSLDRNARDDLVQDAEILGRAEANQRTPAKHAERG